MTHTVIRVPNGKWKQNCYIVADHDSGFGIVIDPGSDAASIRERLSLNVIEPVAILNTHAHYDHIGAVSGLMTYFDIPFYLNSADFKLMRQANLYRFIFDSKEAISIPESTHELTAQNTGLQLGGLEVTVLRTPGHTKGSVCLKIGDDLFSGDTLLPTGPGRIDLPGGDKIALEQSIELLRKLPYETTVWPGHGCSFILGGIWKKLAQA